MSLEAIYSARISEQQPMFQQLYVNMDREKAIALIKRVIGLGATALFVTVYSPVLGKREQDDRLKGEASRLTHLYNEQNLKGCNLLIYGS